MVLSNEYRTFDRLREDAPDNIFEYLDLFRDVGLNSIYERVDALHGADQSNKFLISGDLVSDNLEIQ